MEINWDNSKYKELRDWVSNELVKLEYVIAQDRNTKRVFTKENHHILIVDQRYDPPEIYVGKESFEKNNIRLGFILEYYLTGRIELVKKYNKLNRSGTISYQFYIDFITQHLSEILKIDLTEYYQFGRNKKTEIESLVEELND